MQKILFTTIFTTLVLSSQAHADCVYISSTDNEGRKSEITFPVLDSAENTLIKSGFKKVSCNKAYSVQEITQKCTQLQTLPQKIKTNFQSKFNISIDQMCTYSLAYVNHK